jgi:proteasome lid subunit RPN8/RPN11
MNGAGGARVFHVTRVLAAMAGLLLLLALQPPPARVAGAVAPRALILSEQARRFLTLQYRSFSTEFLGCMLGEVQGRSVIVRRIAPADVDPSASAATHVVPKQTCEAAGWTSTVGMIHSHPGGVRCWYYFPSTAVATSDRQSFQRQPYPIDAIMCGDRVVWISRDMVERQVPLTDGQSAGARPRLTRGNRPQNGGATE